MSPSSQRFPRLHSALAAHPRLLATLIVVLAASVFLAAGWLAWLSYDLTTGLPDRSRIRSLGDMAQATTIYDASDKPAFTIYKEQRLEVPLEKISPNLINAVLSVEDQRFYEHSGVDAVRVAAALVRNLERGRRAEGGSTITQQLARQSFLTRDKTYHRKMQEVILAAYIEKVFSKQDILELYLNKVYFGDGFYGVEAAARGYFGRSASDLTVDEAALLAGLIQSPSSYAPTVNLERAIARRNVVLQTMVSSGAIDAATAQRAGHAQVRLVNGLETKEGSGLYFKEQVRRDLVDRFGWQRVYQGGLRVYTTLDTNLQRQAEAIVEKGIEDIEKRRGYKHPERGQAGAREEETTDYLQGALVALDPATGEVRAMVGGRDFDESRFNRAVQAKRQPGSAFKPFVYAAALEKGYSPASLISGLNNPVLTGQGEWMPEDEHSSETSMTIRTALRTSSNRAAVQMLNTIGIQSAVDEAKKLNFGTPPSVPSIALGASEVSLLQLTAAYGAFADEGVVRQPVLIRRVEDSDGKVLYLDARKSQHAVSGSTAFLMSSMLADVINSGTAYRARQTGFTLPAAGKTGTTNDYMDAWFVGFTPHLVTGVWVGFDQPKTIIANGYAADLAVPIWAGFMKVATRGESPDWFDRPGDVVAVNVCRLSGKLPSVGCSSVLVPTREGGLETRSMIYTEYFRKGTQPTTLCPLHTLPAVTDGLPGMFTDATGAPAPPPDRGTVPATPSAVSTSGSVPPAATRDGAPVEGGVQPEQAKKKKRGFWARVFGVGGDQDKDKQQQEPPKKKPGG